MSHNIQSLLILLVSVCFISGCRGNAGKTDIFTDTIYSPSEATGFLILGREGYRSRLLVSTRPWQGADTASATRLLLLAPGESVPEGFDGQVLKEVPRRIVCMSSTHVAFLDALGITDRVIGASGKRQIANPGIRARIDSVAEVGYEGAYDYEQLLAANPDLVLLYGINCASGIEGKLREMDIPFAYIVEYLEESPLGRAEWIVAIGQITAEEEKAKAFFSRLTPRYEALRDSAGHMKGHRPKIMLNTPYADSWMMASPRSYVGRLISDAAGDYVYTPTDTADISSRPIDMEEAYRMALESDVWLNTGQVNSLGELVSRFPRFNNVPPVKNRQVWNSTLQLQPSGANAYWEEATVYPDRVLSDLIHIFHPDSSAESLMYYYKRLD